ncbi:hypothetical protein BSM4216_1825 [Bacillus smithii]|jgi:hypothetical protein|nr:hypothetical protein BSM4216_1825 [Bacillus smithii]
MGDWSLTRKEERMLNKFDSVKTAPEVLSKGGLIPVSR